MKYMSNSKKMKTIWLSYDLGIRGDYESLYLWLDKLDARECGDSLAVFKYNPREDLVASLKRDLKKNVKIKYGDRIYIIYLKEGRMKGEFIFGQRKKSPWVGYATAIAETEDVEAV